MDRFTTEHGVAHITPMPGLPQVAIVHGVWLLEEYRGHGMGHDLMEAVNDWVTLEHYDLAMCTTADDNKAMQACLSKAGWSKTNQFRNRLAGADHQVWMYQPTPV